jgi:hypothetical protein
MTPKTQPKFFKGTGDNLDALHNEIVDWLDKTGATPTNYLLTTNYDATQDK